MTKEQKKSTIFNIIVLLIYTLSSLFLIYNIYTLNGVENFLRYITMGILTLFNLFLIYKYLQRLFKHKKTLLLMIVIILLTIINIALGFVIYKTYNTLSNLNKTTITYSASLISLNTNENKNINVSKIENKTIGIINDENHYEGYTIGNLIVSENKLKENNQLEEYNDFVTMLTDLYSKKIDYAIVSSSYVSTFVSVDGFENIADETINVLTKEKTVSKEQSNTTLTEKNIKSITEPFTILLLGIDSTSNNISSSTSFNGDSIILVTFNPSTLNATILSIPRDTYVPVSCFSGNRESKITHAAWYGESCMAKTIENLTGIEIDYYAKVNFKALVQLVDAIGGITVDVPYSFCEQNSNRKWGKNTVYVKSGIQKLSGEQALALSRNRKTNSSKCSAEWTKGARNDFIRGQNQQLVLTSIINELKSVKNINQLYDILDIVENNMDTNLTTEQILSFYNIGKNILKVSSNNDNLISIQKLYLSGYDAYLYDSYSGLTLYEFIYYEDSLKEIVKAMKQNLGLSKTTLIKEFSYAIDEKYTQKVIGKGYYAQEKIVTVPNFTAYGKSYALDWSNKNDITITFNTINSDEDIYIDGQIIEQSVSAGTKLTSIIKASGITLTIINKQTTTTIPTTLDCSLEENATNSDCLVPNMSGWTISQMNTWINKVKKYSKLIITTEEMSYSDAIVIDPTYKYATVINQSAATGTNISSIDGITITYVERKPVVTTTTTTTKPIPATTTTTTTTTKIVE